MSPDPTSPGIKPITDPAALFPTIPNAVAWCENPKGQFAWSLARKSSYPLEWHVDALRSAGDRTLAMPIKDDESRALLERARPEMDDPAFTDYVRWKLAQTG